MQVNPSPVKPALQVHILVPPITLVHCAFAEHPPLLAEHSLMSTHKKVHYVIISTERNPRKLRYFLALTKNFCYF